MVNTNMKVLVFGSANIDRTYSVEHFVNAGETLSATKMDSFCGGKGFNQAIAFARAGGNVYFAGAIGSDGDGLNSMLAENGVNTDFVKHVAGPSGHAVIQVTPEGQNSIIILAGANGAIDHDDVDKVLSSFSAGDLVVLQNEISCVDYIIEQAHQFEMVVALNPSPFNERINDYDLSKVDYLLVNEVEGFLLSGNRNPTEIGKIIQGKYPNLNIVLTLGCNGSMFFCEDGTIISAQIYKTNAVDTTAAGDTFTAYFLTEELLTRDTKSALQIAAVASGISVSRHGAAKSIPFVSEVREVIPVK